MQAPCAQPALAVQALIDAMASNDPAALSHVLGKEGRQLAGKFDVDLEGRFTFLQLASLSKTINVKCSRAALVVGTKPWTPPIPMEQGKDGRRRFDTVSASDEMLVLQIGANERAAMQVVMVCVNAQREYAQTGRDGNGLFENAQKWISSPGNRDGAIWSPSLGDETPLGESFLPTRPGAGCHGCRFQILTAQGPAARAALAAT